MRIIGPPSAPRETVAANLAKQPGIHPRFLTEMFGELWDAAEAAGIDPVGVVAQSFKETGGGTFKGKVKPEFRNTAGIKVRDLGLFPGIDDGDNPLAHQRFPSWEIGAMAHVQHLAAYAGLPVTQPIVDPRYWLVRPAVPLENFEELSGKWAPAADYGPSLVTIARRLQAP